MTNLYDMSKELEAINFEIIQADGEISPDLEAKLDNLLPEFREKVQNISVWIKNLDAQATMVEREAHRLAKKERVLKALQERLKGYVAFSMQKAEIRKMEIGALTVKVQKNPPSVQLLDETKLPARYIEIVEEKRIKKQCILDDLKAGEEVEGAVLVIDKVHLRID